MTLPAFARAFDSLPQLVLLPAVLAGAAAFLLQAI